MSRSSTKTATNGYGRTPNSPITRNDIETKLKEITGDVNDTVEAARGIGIAVAVGAGVLFIVSAYWFGKRKGSKRKTVLEIRRI
jgi:hypothetical protein